MISWGIIKKIVGKLRQDRLTLPQKIVMDHKTITDIRKTWELFSVADQIAPPSETLLKKSTILHWMNLCQSTN